MLLGLISRPPMDPDVVARVEDGARYTSAEPLPLELEEARADMGRALGCGEGRLNPGPTTS